MLVRAARPVVMRCRVVLNRGFFADPGNGVAKAADLAADRLKVACCIMRDRHRAGCDRNGHILDPPLAANGGVDLGGAGGAIHSFNAKSGL